MSSTVQVPTGTRTRTRTGSAIRAPKVDRRDLGPLSVGLVVLAQAALWLLARPPGEPLVRHLGQLFGAEAVLLLSVGLILASSLPGVESWFGGLDRATLWHRRAALAGMLVLVPHVALSSNPDASPLGVLLAAVGALGLVALVVWTVLPRWRSVTPAPVRRGVVALGGTRPARFLGRLLGGYERWRSLHRLTGLFVAVGFAHGALDATAFARAPLLRWTYLAVGGVGMLAYAYREVLTRLVTSRHDYRVVEVRRLGGGLTELVLCPVGRPLTFAPGQFTMLSIQLADGWHRHPFTITSRSDEDRVRLVVKALGDYTRDLPTLVRAGAPAVLSDPHGRFDRTTGTRDQVWVAAGVGIAPFLSWARSFDGADTTVDLFLSAHGPSPFEEELRAIAADHPSLRLHTVDSSRRPRLTPEEVLTTVGTPPGALSVYLCGPTAMVGHFERAVRNAGVPRTRVHRERFEWR